MSNEENSSGTIVGVNVALSGTLKDQNDIVVHGMVEGEVVSEKSVTIGETAQVKGPVKGQTVTIAGTVRGEVTAGERLELLATAKIFGSITTRDLVVHSGATLVGKSQMPAGDGTDDPVSEEGDTVSKGEDKELEPPDEADAADLLKPEDE